MSQPNRIDALHEGADQFVDELRKELHRQLDNKSERDDLYEMYREYLDNL